MHNEKHNFFFIELYVANIFVKYKAKFKINIEQNETMIIHPSQML